MIFHPAYSLTSDTPAVAVPAISGGYYMRRRRWMAACAIAFLLLTAL